MRACVRVRFSVSAATNLIKQTSLNSDAARAALTTLSGVQRRLCTRHARRAITQDTHEHAHTPLPFLLRSNLLVSIPCVYSLLSPNGPEIINLSLRSSNVSTMPPLFGSSFKPRLALPLRSSSYHCIFNIKMKTHTKKKKEKEKNNPAQ